jgi:hypothetical protein
MLTNIQRLRALAAIYVVIFHTNAIGAKYGYASNWLFRDLRFHHGAHTAKKEIRAVGIHVREIFSNCALVLAAHVPVAGFVHLRSSPF